MQTRDKKALFIWGLAALFYLYVLILRVSPSVMMHNLSSYYDASASALGVLIAFYYYSYTALQLPCGIILDRLGSKRLLGFSALLCCLGSILFISGSLFHAQFGRFLIGAGSACAFISCLKVASDHFSPKIFALLTGATNMMGTIGGMLGGYPIALLVNSIGWRETMLILAIIGAMLAVLIFLVFPSEKITKSSNRSMKSDILSLIKNKQVLVVGMITGLMYLPICIFSELWAVPYCMCKFNINNETASISSAAIYLGVAMGSILMPLIANHLSSYKKTLQIATLITSVLFLIIFYTSINYFAALSIMFAIGIMTGAQPIGFICAKNNASKELSGTTLAFTNCMVMLLGSIAQPGIGKLLDIFNGKNLPLSECDLQSYHNALLLIPIALIIAFMLLICMKETYNKEINK